MKHLNKKLNVMARLVVQGMLERRGMSADFPAIYIACKQANTSLGMKCYGLNDTLVSAAKRRLRESYIFIVDYREGIILYRSLRGLLKTAEVRGKYFPRKADMMNDHHKFEGDYYAKEQFKTLGSIPPEPLEELRKLAYDNKFPKNQPSMF